MDIRLLRHPRYWAAHRAVTLPLAGFKPRYDDLPMAVERLRKRWWYRLRKMADHGIEPFTDAETLKRFGNCTSFGQFSDGKTPRFCNTPLLCPYCYARSYVIRIYDAIAQHLFVAKQRGCRRTVQLLAFESTHLYQWQDTETYHDALEDAVQDISQHGKQRRRESDAVTKSYGDVILHRLDVQRVSTDLRYLRMRRSGLLLCPPGTTPPVGSRGRWWLLPVSTRQELVSAVVLISRVPRSWWHQINNTAICLDFVRGVRLLSVHGCLRKRHND